MNLSFEQQTEYICVSYVLSSGTVLKLYYQALNEENIFPICPQEDELYWEVFYDKHEYEIIFQF